MKKLTNIEKQAIKNIKWTEEGYNILIESKNKQLEFDVNSIIVLFKKYCKLLKNKS